MKTVWLAYNQSGDFENKVFNTKSKAHEYCISEIMGYEECTKEEAEEMQNFSGIFELQEIEASID